MNARLSTENSHPPTMVWKECGIQPYLLGEQHMIIDELQRQSRPYTLKLLRIR